MVATKLSEVAGKGLEWYSTSAKQPKKDDASPAVTRHPSTAIPPSTSSSSSSSSYWDRLTKDGWEYAQNSMQEAFDQTYSTVGNMMSSVYQGGSLSEQSRIQMNDSEGPMVVENLPLTPRTKTSTSVLTSPSLLNSFFHNPYVGVRGGRHHGVESQSSMKAVRTFLSYVPEVGADPPNSDEASQASSSYTDSLEGQRKSLFWNTSNKDRSQQYFDSNAQVSAGTYGSPSEMASHLAEGKLFLVQANIILKNTSA